MTLVFYLASFVALVSTALVVISRNPVHSLLYLVVSLLAVAMAFFSLGAHFAALLEVIVYAGAIMVLFVYMIMMLNLGQRAVDQERNVLPAGIWIGPAILAGLLAIELGYVLIRGDVTPVVQGNVVGPKEVGIALLDKYYLAVEVGSMLLLAGMVAAFHLGKRDLPDEAAERGSR